MEFNISIRENQLQNFQQFIDSAKSNFKSILDTIGWSEDKLKKDTHLVKCSYDKTHHIAPKNLDEHLKNCSLKHLGYNSDDVQLSEPVNNQNSSILIDNVTKHKVFVKEKQQNQDFKSGWNGEDAEPKTSDRLISMFTSDERLALYKYAISETEGPKIPPELNLSHPIDQDKELTYEERLEHERNAKRRRIKYKSVHTNRKNHTEVIREVIFNHMELYKDCLMQNEHTKTQVVSKTSTRRSQSKSSSVGDNFNNSHDDDRSIISRHSTHSGSSSHYKSQKVSSRGSSSEHRDKHRHRSREYHNEYQNNDHRGRDYRKSKEYKETSYNKHYDERKHLSHSNHSSGGYYKHKYQGGDANGSSKSSHKSHDYEDSEQRYGKDSYHNHNGNRSGQHNKYKGIYYGKWDKSQGRHDAQYNNHYERGNNDGRHDHEEVSYDKGSEAKKRKLSSDYYEKSKVDRR